MDESLTVTLPASEWQLVLNICQQAMAPYQKLGEILANVQRQAQQQQHAQGAQEQQINRPLGPRHPPDVVSGIVDAEQARRPREVPA